MNAGGLFKGGAVHILESEGKFEAIKELIHKAFPLVRTKRKRELEKAVIEREKLQTTACGHGTIAGAACGAGAACAGATDCAGAAYIGGLACAAGAGAAAAGPPGALTPCGGVCGVNGFGAASRGSSAPQPRQNL